MSEKKVNKKEVSVKPRWGNFKLKDFNHIDLMHHDFFDTGYGFLYIGLINPNEVPRKYKIQICVENMECPYCNKGIFECHYNPQKKVIYKTVCDNCGIELRVWENYRTITRIKEGNL